MCSCSEYNDSKHKNLMSLHERVSKTTFLLKMFLLLWILFTYQIKKEIMNAEGKFDLNQCWSAAFWSSCVQWVFQCCSSMFCIMFSYVRMFIYCFRNAFCMHFHSLISLATIGHLLFGLIPVSISTDFLI